MATRREQLRAEVRARTILAGCARARLTALEDGRPVGGCTHAVGLLTDAGGAVHLVVAPGAAAPPGRFRISCRAGAPGLGVLRLEGRCGRPACPEQPVVAEFLAGHRHGAASAAGVTTDEPTVLQVELDAVTVLVPATDTRRAGVVPVDLQAWAAASPDPWILEVEDVRVGLEADAQEELRSLVTARVPAYPEVVAVTDLSPTGLELVCLSRDGVTPVAMAFGRELAHPREVAGHVRHLSRRTA